MRYGGPIVSVHGLCKALARRNHEVHVFTTNVDGKTDSNVPLGVPVAMDGVNIWYFPVPLGRRLYWSPRMGQALRLQVQSFDIVHTHSVFLWPTAAAARAARHCGVPYVVAPRGMLVADLIRRKSPLPKLAWIRLIERYNLERAAVIHVTSRLEAEQLACFGLRLPPVRVVPNGVELSDPGSNAACSAEIADIASGSPYLLFLGRINWKKGLDRLIRALAQLPSLQLVIAGNDEEAYRPTLEALAGQGGVSNRIRFVGPVYNADKSVLLRHATVLVVPSYSENFGNVVIEAMAEGCPVVVASEVGAADIVRESGAGVVLNANPDTLAAGIADMIADPTRLSAMGECGRKAVTNQYTWDAVAARMEDTYRSVLSRQGTLDHSRS